MTYFRGGNAGLILSRLFAFAALISMPMLLMGQTLAQKSTKPLPQKESMPKAVSGLKKTEYKTLNVASTMKDFKRLFKNATCITGCGADDKFAGSVPARFQALFENAGGRISSLTIKSETWNLSDVIAALDNKFGKHETTTANAKAIDIGSESLNFQPGARHRWVCLDGEIVLQTNGKATYSNGRIERDWPDTSEALVYTFRYIAPVSKTAVPVKRESPKIEASKL